ncbi:MAG: hypothetical protein Fur0046_01900 [Cyanobacteria bacterium J069]
MRVYSTPAAIAQRADLELSLIEADDLATAIPTGETLAASPPPEAEEWAAIACFVPHHLPEWLVTQQQLPRLTQLDTGELLIPILAQEFGTMDADAALSGSPGTPLQLLLQVGRSPQSGEPFEADDGEDSAPSPPQAFSPLPNSRSTFSGWSPQTVTSLKRLGDQLGLAYNSLLWREKFERSQRQIALMGRIVHLLNSRLETDDILQQIAAELGQGLTCDRCLLMRLQAAGVGPVAHWARTQADLAALPSIESVEVWQPVIDTFLDNGASYLTVRADTAPTALQNWLRHLGAVSALLVPIFIQADFFGVVCLLDHSKIRYYAVDEVQTVGQVGDHAAIALVSAQHHHDSHRQTTLRLQVMTPQINLRDAHTQLLNREAFEQELRQLSRPALWTAQPPFSLIVCDIDYFKLINDAYGFSVGDQILSQLAQRLRRRLRQGTLAYRYGGEEFALILPRTPLGPALDVADRLLNAIHGHPFETAAGPVAVTVSFGVAQQDPRGDRDAWSVLQRADQALQNAKRQGRDCAKALEFGLGA